MLEPDVTDQASTCAAANDCWNTSVITGLCKYKSGTGHMSGSMLQHAQQVKDPCACGCMFALIMIGPVSCVLHLVSSSSFS